MHIELDGMVRNEQYKDFVREAMNARQAAEASPHGVKSPTGILVLLPVLLVSAAARLSSLWGHMGRPS